MTSIHCLITIALAVLPISELRGAIPYAYFNGAPLFLAALIGVLANLLVAPIVYLFLGSLHRVFYRIWGWYRSFFDRFVERARKKVEHHFSKWGYIGLA
ncbi:MAG TPA: small multi-drug export protein, partial [Sphaerochaeta sp.]|nr:small multi-drug export protein [Sphaerochaeta sp.]